MNLSRAKVTVIIPTFNRPDGLRATIGSLQRQSFPSEFFEIVVVDNSESGYANKIVKAAKGHNRTEIRCVRESRTGLHYARHTGAENSVAEILAYCDDDIVAGEEWVESLYSTYSSDSQQRIGAVGGKVIPKFKIDPPYWYKYFGNQDNCGALSILNLGEGVRILNNGQNIYGCNFSVRRSVLYECGGFNPDIFYPPLEIYSGDGETGLLTKIRNRGFDVAYNSRAYLYHVIPPERLQKRYFMVRYYRQGLTRAYTEYRALRGQRLAMHKYLILTKLRLFWFTILCKCFVMTDRSIYFQAMRIYLKTIVEHSLRLLNQSELGAYVLQDSYLDAK